MNTRAMVLAAGLGTRLGALTANTPKCLIEVHGKSMLAHVIEHLKKAGVTSVVINLHHFPKLIEEHVAANNNFGIEILYSREDKLLGTGGAIKAARQHFTSDQPFIVYNADVFCEVNLGELIQKQTLHNSAATLVCQKRTEDSYLLFNSENSLVGWEVKGKGEYVLNEVNSARLAFCGIQIISPKIFSIMDKQPEVFSIIETYLEAVRQGFSVKAYQISNEYWADMGTPLRLTELRSRLRN